MPLPTASWWSGRSPPAAALLFVLSAAVVLAGPPVRLLADKPECFKEGNGAVTFELVDGCTNADATLVFKGDTLEFDIAYTARDHVSTGGTLQIGACSGSFSFERTKHGGNTLKYNGNSPDGKDSWPGKATASEVMIKDKPSNCPVPPKFDDAGEGKKKTTVSFAMDKPASGFKFTFKDATLEKKKSEDDAGAGEAGGFSGWKLWTTVGVGALLLLGAIAAVVVVIVCCVRKKKAAVQTKEPLAKTKEPAAKTAKTDKPKTAEPKADARGTVNPTAGEGDASKKTPQDPAAAVIAAAEEMEFDWEKEVTTLIRGPDDVQRLKLTQLFGGVKGDDQEVYRAFLRRFPLDPENKKLLFYKYTCVKGWAQYNEPVEHRVFYCKLAAIMYAFLIAYDALEAEKKAAGGEATPTAAGGSKQPVDAAGGSKQAA